MSSLAAALNVQVDVVGRPKSDIVSIDGAVNLLQGSFAPGGMLGSPDAAGGSRRRAARRVVQGPADLDGDWRDRRHRRA